MRINHVSSRFLIPSLLAALSIGCGGGGTDDPGGGGNPPPPPPPANPTATGNVGAAGGTVAFADNRFKLEIPAGALANDTAITVTELTGANIPAEFANADADVVYQLEPNGLQFATPARATVKRPASLNPPAGQSNLVFGVLNSNGTAEVPADETLTLDDTGATLVASIPHFSHYVIGGPDGVAVIGRVDLSSLQVGQSVNFTATVRKAATGVGMEIPASQFLIDGVLVEQDRTPLTPTHFATDETGEAETILSARCNAAGASTIDFVPRIEVVKLGFLGAEFGRNVGGAVNIRTHINCDDLPPPPGNIIPTGVWSAPGGLRGLEGVHIVLDHFADFTEEPPYGLFAGEQGFVAVSLKNRAVAYNGTGVNALVGTNLLGVRALSRSPGGRDSTAMLIGFGNSNSLNRHYLGDIRDWGFGEIGLRASFDAKTENRNFYADSFAILEPSSGVSFKKWDAAQGLYTFRSSLDKFNFGGELIGMEYTSSDVDVPPKSLFMSRSTATEQGGFFYYDGAQKLPLTRFDGDARSLRCVNFKCFATWRNQNKIHSLDWNGTDTPTVNTPIDVPADPLSLDVAPLLNGNAFVATWSIGANVIWAGEIGAGGTVISHQEYPVPAGCNPPGNLAVIEDDEGMKGVLSCHGNGVDNGGWAVLRIGTNLGW